VNLFLGYYFLIEKKHSRIKARYNITENECYNIKYDVLRITYTYTLYNNIYNIITCVYPTMDRLPEWFIILFFNVNSIERFLSSAVFEMAVFVALVGGAVAAMGGRVV